MLLTERGLRGEDTTGLWRAVTAALIPAEAADGAAAEIVLLLMPTGAEHGYEQRNHRVAEILAGEGWHTGSGVPIESGQSAGCSVRSPAGSTCSA
ncbi:hypothetical protein [Actinokineospora sp.]|uniref:hypothetical protein n=1 Tax=Actinokineospora sp. TaxID=1872133 RepID=UPI003D6B8C57